MAFMKKLTLVLIISLLIPFLISAGGQSEDSSTVSTAGSSADGRIEYLEGEVLVNGAAADFGTAVPYGAVVKTGTDSYCEVVFDGKNIFRIMESTVVTVMISAGSSEIDIEQGAFAALFTKLETFTSDEPFKIRTGTTLAGVRGTAFFIKVEDPDTTYVCICNGELQLSEPDGGNSENVSSGHHKAARYKNVDGSMEISSAPLLYHTDEDMEALAARIEETIPWDYKY